MKVPAETAVTTPELSTVAIALSELVHGLVASGVPLPVKVTVLPPT